MILKPQRQKKEMVITLNEVRIYIKLHILMVFCIELLLLIRWLKPFWCPRQDYGLSALVMTKTVD